LAYVGRNQGCYVKRETYEFVGEGLGEFDAVPMRLSRDWWCLGSRSCSKPGYWCLRAPSKESPCPTCGHCSFVGAFSCCMLALGLLGVGLLVAVVVGDLDDGHRASGTHRLASREDGATRSEGSSAAELQHGHSCSAGLLDWNLRRWSDERKEWCCQHANTGCDHLGYDCLQGDAHAWPQSQRKFCCKSVGLGCSDDDFDCQEDLKTWTIDWTFGKKRWCCSQGGPCENLNSTRSGTRHGGREKHTGPSTSTTPGAAVGGPRG